VTIAYTIAIKIKIMRWVWIWVWFGGGVCHGLSSWLVRVFVFCVVLCFCQEIFFVFNFFVEKVQSFVTG